MNTLFSTAHVDVLSLGRDFNLETLETYAQQHAGKRTRDAMHLKLSKGLAFVFDYGVLVTWGINASTKQQLQTELSAHLIGLPGQLHWEQFKFSIAPDSPAGMHNDHIRLPKDETAYLLAVSHALAQSAKLVNFETHAESLIVDNSKLVNHLAETGKIPLSRKQIAKLRGTLFRAKSDIVLHFNLLDTPEYFWDNPALEPIYKDVARYLELSPRVELLSLKLGTISELLDMLANEQNHKYSSILEWIIILLIAFEIVLFFVH